MQICVRTGRLRIPEVVNMKHHLLRSIFIILAFMCAGSCLQFSGKIEDRLRSAILATESMSLPVFAMTNVTDFVWDQLYIFGPYMPVPKIEKVIGCTWSEAKNPFVDGDDTICFLVFLNKGRLVKHLYYKRMWGDFAAIGGTNGFSPSDSLFFVNHGAAYIGVTSYRPSKQPEQQGLGSGHSQPVGRDLHQPQ